MSIYNASVILAQKSEKIVTKYKDLYPEYGQVDLIEYGSEKEESANNFYNYLQSIVNEIYQESKSKNDMSIYNASVILAQKSEKIVTKYKDLYPAIARPWTRESENILRSKIDAIPSSFGNKNLTMLSSSYTGQEVYLAALLVAAISRKADNRKIIEFTKKIDFFEKINDFLNTVEKYFSSYDKNSFVKIKNKSLILTTQIDSIIVNEGPDADTRFILLALKASISFIAFVTSLYQPLTFKQLTQSIQDEGVKWMEFNRYYYKKVDVVNGSGVTLNTSVLDGDFNDRIEEVVDRGEKIFLDLLDQGLLEKMIAEMDNIKGVPIFKLTEISLNKVSTDFN